MRAMRIIAILMLVVLGACSKDGGPSSNGSATSPGSGSTGSSAKPGSAAQVGGDDFDQAIVTLEGYRTKMCACTDKACAEAIQGEFKAWRMNLRGKLKGRKPSKEQDERGNAVDRELKACRRKFEDAPPAGGSADPSKLPLGSASTSSDPIEKALAELEQFRVKMCACKDKPCADKVHEEFKTWKANLKASVAERPNKAQDERGNALDKQLKACRKIAEGGPAGDAAKLDAFIVKMESLKDKMCACKDKSCGTAVNKEATDIAAVAGKDLAGIKASADQDTKARKVKGDMKACESKLK
jgi:hypothetical protein